MTRTRRIALCIAAIVAVYAAIDLLAPRSHDLRRFDPREVARLDSDMWRSYYDHSRLRLFLQLATLLRTQYGLPPLRSHVVAYHAARAAVVFQRGHNRAEYELALPSLRNFYQAIARTSVQSFDVERAARLELEWWIIHRERESRPPGDLPQALANLQAELYHMPAERFAGHARDRADAMLLRDGHTSSPDWPEIERKLRSSWKSLWDAVNAGP